MIVEFIEDPDDVDETPPPPRVTIGDLLRFATSRFLEAGLDFRSGMGSADLDAAFLIAELLHLEPAALADQLDARVVPGEARRILEVVRER